MSTAESLSVQRRNKRIANEFDSKVLNEDRKDRVVRAREEENASPHSSMIFHCECDVAACEETISISTGEYERMHHKNNYFIVIPSHVRPDLERIVSSFGNYAQVAKTGDLS